MIVPHVTLHVGAMKTGTTYVQRMLGRNRERLASGGVFYPHPWSDQVVAVRDVLDLKGGSHLGSVDGAWQALISQLHDWQGAQAILSVEFLSFADERQVHRIIRDLAPSEVSIVIGARDLGRALPAQWQTAVRNGRTTTYRDYLEGVTGSRPSPSRKHFWKRQDIGKIAAKWAKEVGQGNVTVVTVPPKGADPGELWRRMSRAFGISEGDLEQPSAKNESLGLTATELLRRINLQADSTDMSQWTYQHGVNRALSHAVLPDVPDPRPQLGVPRGYHRWVTDEAQRVIREVGDSHVTVVGDLADLTPQLTGSDVKVWPEDIPDGELLPFAVATLTQFSQNVADQKLRETKRGRKKNRARGPDDTENTETDPSLPSSGDDT